MRKILWATVIILFIGLIILGLAKIPKNLSFKKSPPVQTASIEPVVQIEGTNLYLAEDGQVLAQSAAQKPLLFLAKNSPLEPGQRITDDQVLFALKIAAILAASDFAVSSLRLLDSGNIAAYNPQSAVAIFSQNKDLNLQIDSLQQVLAKAKIDATKIAKIDLRFDKPVITFK